MGRSILSIKLAVGFAVVAVLVLGALGRAGRLQLHVEAGGAPARIEALGAALPADVPAAYSGTAEETTHGLDGDTAGEVDARRCVRPAYSAARVGVPPELLDALPLWRGGGRDCGRPAFRWRGQRARA